MVLNSGVRSPPHLESSAFEMIVRIQFFVSSTCRVDGLLC